MKKKLPTILLILVFLLGLSLLLYPTVSDYWNSLHQSRAIASYVADVSNIDDEQYEILKGDAQAYNQSLRKKTYQWDLTDDERRFYNSLLDVSGTGIIGYIEIPKIRSSLAIYHGVDENVLQIAVGHIEGSSLPVGGESTHCVLSGHRGLPSAKLFSDLDQLTEGDTFMIRVLDETLTYEVDQILIVEPDEMNALKIVRGQDYCTLVTCTPYGINSHRLLVRGHRIENTAQSDNIRVTADALQIEPLLVTPIVATPLLVILLTWVLISTRNRKRQRNRALEDKERDKDKN